MRKLNRSLLWIKAISTMLFCTVSIVVPANAQLKVVDDVRGFTLDLEVGWQSNPDYLRPEIGIVHALQYSEPGVEQARFLLLVKEMPGTLGRESLDVSMMPLGFEGSLFKIQWQGFEVDGFSVPESSNGVQLLTLNVQIPLKRAAVQMMLHGSAEDEVKLKEFLPVILSGLKGESNWLAPTATTISPGVEKQEETSPVLFLFVGLVALVGLVLLWMLSRYAPKGTALAIGVVIFVAGWLVSPGLSREIHLIKGSLQIFGTAAILLGIVDAIRKRDA